MHIACHCTKKGLCTDVSALHSSRLSKLKWQLLMFETLTPAFTCQLHIQNCIAFNLRLWRFYAVCHFFPTILKHYFWMATYIKKLFTENIQMNISNFRPHNCFMIFFTFLFSLLCLFLSVKNSRYLYITFKIEPT